MAVPKSILDFVSDLHNAVKYSQRLEDVSECYESRFKEITEKYFAASAWPEPRSIASECYNDEDFLLFYREMTLRHVFTCQKIKPQISDHMDSWANYVKLFDFVVRTADRQEVLLTTQWAADIITEFVYQFQGFCQYRTQVQNRSPDDIRTLDANRSVWALPKVVQILKSLIKIAEVGSPSILHQQLGVFAAVELARLQCLIGDYTSSLSSASPLMRNDYGELFAQVPAVQITLYYHAGVCSLLLRRYVDALSTFSEIILYVHRVLKLGSNQIKGSQSQIQKKMDNILALTAIAMALCPGVRVDDQVRELVEGKGSRRDDQSRDPVEGKWAERLRRLNDGDITTFSDLFELSCPKFIHPAVPDYSSSTNLNLNAEAFNTQVGVFKEEVYQHFSVLKIRSYLRLYASIDISKLARFNEVSEAAFLSQLLSFKHKSMQVQTGSDGTDERVSVSDVGYYINGNDLVIDPSTSKSDKSLNIERHFASGIRKHAEIKANLTRHFARFGL